MRWSIFAMLFVLVIASPCFAEWDRTYSELGHDWAYSAVQTPDTGFIVTGFTAYRAPMVWLFKLNSDGDIIWSRIYSDSLPSTGYSVIMATPDEGMPDGYMIAGSYGVEDIGPSDIYVLRTDLNGDTLWTRKWDGNWCHYVAYIEDAYLLAGYDGDAEIIKFTDSGDTLWIRSYGLPGGIPDAAFSIVAAANDEDGYLFVGYKLMPDHNLLSKIWVVRIDSDGNLLWDRSYDWGNENDIGYAMIQSGDGYVITGRKGWTAYVMKIDASGNMVWENTYDGVVGHSIIEDPDGGYVIAGYKYSNEFLRDVWLFKIDTDGNFLWEQTFNLNSNNDEAWTVAPTFSGEYLIAGYTHNNAYVSDAYVILTPGEQTPVEETKVPKPEALMLSVYPNPFNSSVIISTSENAEIKIFDITGRLIHEIPERASNHIHAVWEPEESVVSGVYFIRTKACEKSVTKRVVYLK